MTDFDEKMARSVFEGLRRYDEFKAMKERDARAAFDRRFGRAIGIGIGVVLCIGALIWVASFF